ncbi:PDDEXK nuclease domain-containing protein [Streptomyces sp. NRRL B-1347]|uniref:PDDEXK nuclease domain-containing protein n=1 Tax=Streptomyces sp. NRRL B-1347 TaxID=1476877 RepID=UPI00068F3057|nr:PDDEXK nuclease domain-containing protein [Streptomyces sp. NRRL B-1347]
MHKYEDLLAEAKATAEGARLRTRRAVNTELVQMYWRIGKLILARQTEDGWGTGIVARLATDLRGAFPRQRIFSYRNLVQTPKMAHTWPALIAQRPVAQLPWSHITVLLDKLHTRAERDFYATEAVRNGWSRAHLNLAIRQRLHLPQRGTTPLADDVTLPAGSPALAELACDPYRLDFLRLDDKGPAADPTYEESIANRMVRVLTGLGTGFAFVGCRYPVLAGDQYHRVDLLFYHLTLRRYVACALGTTTARPTHLTRLDTQVRAVDRLVRDPDRDAPTIGVLIETSSGQATYTSLPPRGRQLLPTEEDLARVLREAIGPVDAAPHL